MRACTAVLVLTVALIIGGCGYLGTNPAVLWYRLSTSVLALHALWTLPQEHVDEFIGSYEIFDQEAINGTSKEHEHIVNYYKVVNHLCAVGEVEKMYIPPVMDLSIGIFANQMLWEEKGMADKLEIGPGKRVLDVGCGRGRIAFHVASHTGAKVVGLNIDKTQIKIAKEYAVANNRLGTSLDFQEGNYNEGLPFEDESFDAMYHVQALTYVQDLVVFLKELKRVLKPGSKISFLDWFVLPAYNAKDSHHRRLLAEVKALIGAVKTPTPEEYAAALKEAGFDMIFSGEASTDGGHQWPLVKSADKFYLTVKGIVDFATDYKLIPGHFKVLLERLTRGGEAFVEADQKGLFTTSWQIIAQKPAM